VSARQRSDARSPCRRLPSDFVLHLGAHAQPPYPRREEMVVMPPGAGSDGDMNLPLLFVCLGAAASVVLLAQHRPLLFPALAAIASTCELLTAFHVVHISIARVPLGAVFGALLALGGLGTWARAGGKLTISAATLAALVGIVQTLTALRLIH
jgi:hypothetical protein